MGRPSTAPDFKDIILSCLLLDHTSLGRYRLSTFLGLTKAKTRAVLEYLIEENLAEASRGRGGTHLTQKGKEMMEEITQVCRLDWQQQLITVDETLISSDHETANLFMRVTDLQTSGLYERDTAVRQGAEGAITIIQEDETWYFPGDNRIEVDDIQIRQNDDLDRFNMLTITFSKDIGSAYAGIAAILIYHLGDIIISMFEKYAEL